MSNQVSLGKFVINGKPLVTRVAATGLYVNRKVQSAGQVFGAMTKCDARRLRKSLRKVGRTDLSGAVRQPAV